MNHKPKWRKLVLTALVLCVGVMAWSGVVNEFIIGKTILHRIDSGARTYLDRTMTKSLVTYAVVRSLNAVISVIQESDVALSPAGLGVSIAAGEILDPVNDLIERFSWVVLASTTSLGIQRVVMEIAVWLGFRVFLTLSMAAFLAGLWLDRLLRWDFKKLGIRLLLLSVFIRFAIPAIAFATDRIDNLFLNQTYARASENLEQASQTIEEEGSVESGEVDTQSGWIRSLYENLRTTVRIEERMRAVKETVSGYIEHIIDLIVVFILQTIVIPLVILWILFRMSRGFIGGAWSERIHAFFRERMVGTQNTANRDEEPAQQPMS